MRTADHFHATLKRPDGSVLEVEGGWVAYPAGWDDMTTDEKWAVLLDVALSWTDEDDMVNGAVLENFRLAG